MRASEILPLSGIETPNTKLQTPKKSQVPSSKPRPALRAWNLELGASLVFGVWCLVVFDSLPELPLSPSLSPLLRRGEREKTLRRSRSRSSILHIPKRVDDLFRR